MMEPKLHEMVTNRTQKYLSQMEQCRRQPGEEAIHDVRVAARRVSAALRFCEEYLPAKRVAKVQVKLAGLLKMLNPLRDAQVMAASIADTAHPLHSDRQFADWLRRQASEQEQIAEVAFAKPKPPGPSPKSLAALLAKASKKNSPIRPIAIAEDGRRRFCQVPSPPRANRSGQPRHNPLLSGGFQKISVHHGVSDTGIA